MPQSKRKTPFSGKAKKQQLQSKKQNKNLLLSGSSSSTSHDVVALNCQPNYRMQGRGDRNRYALKFYRETDEELRLKKEDALRALKPSSEQDLEVVSTKYFPPEVTFPKRPPWNFDMTPAQLDMQEHRYFTEYISSLENLELWKDMSYFELNLETWRQLWRVMEMSDVLLLIVDIRFAGLMFPPSLYHHIVEDQKKDMILVVNKIDLVPPAVVLAWKQYFTSNYPRLKVVYFTTCPGYNLRGNTQDKAGLQVRRRKGKLRMCAEGATKLLEACKEIVQGHVDLTSWENKIRDESDMEIGEGADTEVGETILTKPDTSYYKHEKFRDGVLTIGCVGQPNVGKSSLMNAIMGRKVVSVSRTPGHTKHFQTIFLTPEVKLCDCPGLVFPSTVPRSIQILMGSYPIAQLREPYTTIRFIAESLDLPKLLRIDHPEKDDSWSPRDVCDGWAKKRGFLTAKTSRLDTYRAANDILRMALDGKICLYMRPAGYSNDKEVIHLGPSSAATGLSPVLFKMDNWQKVSLATLQAKFESSEELQYVKWVQAQTGEVSEQDSVSDGTDSHADSSESEEDSDTVVAAVANKFDMLASDD